MSTPDLQQLVLQLQGGAIDQVIETVERAVADEPAHVAAHVVLARALAAAGRNPEAMAAWRTAFLLCPDSPVIRRGLRRCASQIAEHVMAPLLESAAIGVDFTAVTPSGELAGYQDLDVLIQDLEAARIVPDPNVEPARPEDVEVDVDDVVSETLARIYANQRFYTEAARVYEKLADQHPERGEEFRQKALDIRHKMDQ